MTRQAWSTSSETQHSVVPGKSEDVRSKSGAIACNLDGTQVDTAPELAGGLNQALQTPELPCQAERIVAGWIGSGAGQLLYNCTGRVARPERAANCRLSQFLGRAGAVDSCCARHCGTSSRLFHGARQQPGRLGEVGLGCPLVTNKATSFTMWVLRHLDTGTACNPIFCNDSLPVKKPHPAGLQACTAHLDIAPRWQVYIGDSGTDTATARAAGTQACGVSYGYNPGQPTGNSLSDKIFNKPGQVLQVLCQTRPKQPLTHQEVT